MSLDPSWKNLAENLPEFERRAEEARAAEEAGPFALVVMIPVLVTAALPLYLFLGVTGSFQEDKWAQAFGFMVLLAISLACIKHIFRFVVVGLKWLTIVGLFCWVGSCLYGAVSSKVAREFGDKPAEAALADPGAPEMIETDEVDPTALYAQAKAKETRQMAARAVDPPEVPPTVEQAAAAQVAPALANDGAPRGVLMPSTPISAVRLIAVVTGIAEARAMLVDERGASLVVSRGDYLGQAEVARHWQVARIRENEVLLTREDPSSADHVPLILILSMEAPGEGEAHAEVECSSARECNAKGMRRYKSGEYDEALAYLLAAQEHDPSHGLSAYNAACIYALRGDAPASVAMLGRVERSGDPCASEIMDNVRSDDDFDRIRSSREFLVWVSARESSRAAVAGSGADTGRVEAPIVSAAEPAPSPTAAPGRTIIAAPVPGEDGSGAQQSASTAPSSSYTTREGRVIIAAPPPTR